MSTTDVSVAWMLALGAVHGINPAMGWLFALSLGLQEQRRSAVWRALGPLALGHAVAIGVAVAVAAAIGAVVPLRALKLIAAAALLSFGVFHLTRHRHPRLAGMRVGARDLAVWSFLMASAHGAGLMVLPFVLGAGEHAHGAGHAAHLLVAGLPTPPAVGLVATLAHTAGYLLVAGSIAVVVYERLGLRLLRTAWINLNAIWAGAPVLTALMTPFM